MTKRRLTKAERDRKHEADRKEFLRQVRALRLRPWESLTFAPCMTRGKRCPFGHGTPEAERWEKMAELQRRLDARRARRVAAKQPKPENSK